MNLKEIQASIVAHVLGNPYVCDDCQNFVNEISNDGTQYHQSVAQITPDDDLFVIFNTPTVTKTVFITVSDGDISLIRSVLANLEGYEREGNELSCNDVIPFSNEKLKDSGVAGIILLPLPVSGVLCDLPDTITIKNEQYSFLLVAFLSNEEYEHWKKNGFDSLMSLFDKIDKDLLTFKQ